jgi:hypothetical protein
LVELLGVVSVLPSADQPARVGWGAAKVADWTTRKTESVGQRGWLVCGESYKPERGG